MDCHTPDELAQVRRFNRAVTQNVGALDTSFLGRGRSLGAARIVSEVGQGRYDVGEMRRRLGLDSGLLSRLLRALEADGLITTHPHPDDARRRLVHLTDKGRQEFASYETLSDAHAAHVLAQHRDRPALLAAMELVTCALGRDRIDLVECDPRSEAALYCLNQYYSELAERFSEGFDVDKSLDPTPFDMMRPRGMFLVAQLDGVPLGCVGLKGTGGPVGEVKRLWVLKCARGIGLAKRLMVAVEEAAVDLKFTTLRLDTKRLLTEAVTYYQSAGWSEVDRFNDDPYPDIFFEKHLSPRS
ncbi:MAG: helix-turn-helix domain-containing GNAT family N-acetyltransferase [Pseudomonadota bacterium]